MAGFPRGSQFNLMIARPRFTGNVPLDLGIAKNCNSANKYCEKSCAPNCFHIKLVLILQNHKVAFAMENQELTQQRPDDEPRRLEYKSTTLRKLGKLTDVTLTTDTGSGKDNA